MKYTLLPYLCTFTQHVHVFKLCDCAPFTSINIQMLTSTLVIKNKEKGGKLSFNF